MISLIQFQTDVMKSYHVMSTKVAEGYKDKVKEVGRGGGRGEGNEEGNEEGSVRGEGRRGLC